MDAKESTPEQPEGHFVRIQPLFVGSGWLAKKPVILAQSSLRWTRQTSLAEPERHRNTTRRSAQTRSGRGSPSLVARVGHATQKRRPEEGELEEHAVPREDGMTLSIDR